jgi:hypothetical protein
MGEGNLQFNLIKLFVLFGFRDGQVLRRLYDILNYTPQNSLLFLTNGQSSGAAHHNNP